MQFGEEDILYIMIWGAKNNAYSNFLMNTNLCVYKLGKVVMYLKYTQKSYKLISVHNTNKSRNIIGWSHILCFILIGQLINGLQQAAKIRTTHQAWDPSKKIHKNTMGQYFPLFILYICCNDYVSILFLFRWYSMNIMQFKPLHVRWHKM